MARRAIAIAAGLCALAVAPGAGAQSTLEASCPGPNESTLEVGNGRVAQTFAATSTGLLTDADVLVRRQPTTSSDFVIEIREVDGVGAPTNIVLASTSVAAATLPVDQLTLIHASFADPAPISAGVPYAVAARRAGAETIGVGVRDGDDCSGQLFQSGAMGAFTPAESGLDLVYSVYVRETDPPETTIVESPKPKTRRRAATFAFATDEPGSTFLCSLDGAPAEPCSSPIAFAGLKRKRHSFLVSARDVAGNVDQTPATFDWRIKKKRRK